MYETDYLLFHTEDFTAVLNALIETFSLYAKWEHALNQLLYQSSSLQDLLSVSDAVIDAPLLVLDQSDRLIAVTPKYETVSVSAEWFDLLERKGASTERILQFHDQSLGYYDVNNKEPFYLDSLFPTPCYSLNLWEGDTFFGLLVLIEHDEPLCGGTVDEFQMLGQYVCQWMKQNSSSDLFSMEQSLLAEAINEHPDGIANLERYLHTKGWKRTDTLQFFFARVLSSQFHMDAFLCNTLSAASPFIYASPLYHGCLILCNVSRYPSEELSSLFYQWFHQSKYSYGSSVSFTDLQLLPAAYQQARIALTYGDGTPGHHSSILDTALTYMLQTLKGVIPAELYHPAIAQLLSYDAKHNTELKKTLQMFLLKGQNHGATAEALHIHRNTLQQRLHRLKEQFLIDFSNETVCLYLLLSSYLAEGDACS